MDLGVKLGVEDDLKGPGVIPQIDKDKTAEVPSFADPTVYPYFLTFLPGRYLAAVGRSLPVFVEVPLCAFHGNFPLH